MMATLESAICLLVRFLQVGYKFDKMLKTTKFGKIHDDQSVKSYFDKREINHYLHLLTEDEIITKFLEYDKCHRLADNYLLAMVFVYFIRVGLPVADYSFTNFFAALLLAHSLVEENESFIDEIMYWALPNCSDDRLMVRQLEELKFLMLKAMGWRGQVSRTACNAVMLAVTHPLWSRKRDQVHAGVYKRASEPWSKQTEHAFNFKTASCRHCRKARHDLLSRGGS